MEDTARALVTVRRVVTPAEAADTEAAEVEAATTVAAVGPAAAEVAAEVTLADTGANRELQPA